MKLQKHKYIFFSILLFATIFLFACNSKQKYSGNYMALNNVEYVTKFPYTYDVRNFEMIVIDSIIGYFDFLRRDTFLFFSTNDGRGFWNVISSVNNQFLGKFIKRGQGPNEFIFSPNVQNDANFFENNGNIHTTVYDSQKGYLYKINITSSIESQETDIILIKKGLPKSLFNIVMIDTTQYLCKEMNHNYTQQIRYILDIKNENKTSFPYFEQLNQAVVSDKDNSNINIIAAFTKYNKNKNIIVEAPAMLNYLNLYSLNGSMGKTICIGKKMSGIETVQDIHHNKRLYTFSDLELFDNFWGVLYINANPFTIQTDNRRHYPSIFLFDWEGRPMAELKLNRHITSFDIDLNTGFLYGLDYVKETFFRYDIREILNEIGTIDMANITKD